MTFEIKNLFLVENAKSVPPHFTVELEGLKDQGRVCMDERSTWSPTWQAMDKL